MSGKQAHRIDRTCAKAARRVFVGRQMAGTISCWYSKGERAMLPYFSGYSFARTGSIDMVDTLRPIGISKVFGTVKYLS